MPSSCIPTSPIRCSSPQASAGRRIGTRSARRGKIARSRDGGNTWQRLLGGLPNGQRALFSALTIEAWPGGSALYAVDTDGEVFESTDEGDNWTIIAEVPPVSKGEFYRALARDRGKLAVDDIVVSKTASERLAKVVARR
jgi:hypothetical protein